MKKLVSLVVTVENSLGEEHQIEKKTYEAFSALLSASPSKNASVKTNQESLGGVARCMK